MHKKSALLVVFSLVISGFIVNANAQKSGQSVSITHGVVTSVKDVKLDSNAGKAGLVGGTMAVLASSGKKSSKKARNALIAGGATAAMVSKSEGDRSGREYTVDTGHGFTVIVSDQTQIVIGDCVVVENGGSNKANIRRVSPSYCSPESQEVVAELHDEMMEEAVECVMAKDELIAAQTDAEVDRAIRKMSMLCDD